MFRAGNARGNEIAEASITVSALIEEMSPEGNYMRRLHDLELVRDNTPLFYLSWQVMHPIDEDSPLYGMDWENLGDEVVLITVTMMGHDPAYGQETYARHVYLPEDIRVGQRFVDVLSETEDGRMLLDLTHFHDTEPAPEPQE